MKRPVKKKRTNRELYERVVRSSQAAALNENLSPELRSYYAGVALHYDNRLTNIEKSV